MAVIEIKKSYVVELSTKTTVRIDPDELPNLLEGMRRGVPVMLKQGLVNPSYVVAVREDAERFAKFIEDTKYPQDAARRSRGMEPLANIFKDTPLIARSADKKQIAQTPIESTQAQHEPEEIISPSEAASIEKRKASINKMLGREAQTV